MAAHFSFQAKVTAVFAALLSLVLLTAFVATYQVILASTFEQIRAELNYSKNAVTHQLSERMAGLGEATQILSRDFGFRKAVATGDVPTIKSVSENFSTRTEGSRIMVTDLQGRLLADTDNPDPARYLPVRDRLDSVVDSGFIDGMMTLEGMIYQYALAPVLTPDPVGFLVVAKPVDPVFARGLQQQLPGNSDLSFLLGDAAGRFKLVTTTLQDDLALALARNIMSRPDMPVDPVQTRLDGIEYALVTNEIRAQDSDTPVLVVLQYSMDVALAPYKTLYLTLFGIFLFGLVFGILGALGVSRSVTRPIRALVQATERIKSGDYGRSVALQRRDEIGQLADAFDLMMEGIAQREEHIQHQAEYDTLTGLPNRRYVESRINVITDDCRANATGCTVLLVCIERFSEINSTLGHDVGDKLVCVIADQLKGAFKSSDTVARIGSDIFTVIVPDTEPATVPVLAERLLDPFMTPFLVDGITIDVSAHIGAACYPAHTDTPAMLLRCADRAAFAARDVISRYAVYDPRSDNSNRIRLSLMGELREAVSRDGFELYYQPQIEIGSQRLLRVEALIRWRHPDLGYLSPDQFVPLAERTGDIHRLTRWVLTHGVMQLAQWSARGINLDMSINLSAMDLHDRNLPSELADLLACHGVNPKRLVLEITESALMHDPERVIDVLRMFRGMGVGLAVDDFGTGYSSLTYLSRFPVTELKIDKAFVIGMEGNAQDASIVKSVIELGHCLSLDVVAEGVEAYDMLRQLHDMGCDLAQGYGIARPMPARDLEVWIGKSYQGERMNYRPKLVVDQ